MRGKGTFARRNCASAPAGVVAVRSRVAMVGLAIALAAICGGCNSVDPFSLGASDVRTGAGVTARADAAPEHPSDKIIVKPISPDDLDCPSIDIADGGATYRVGGPDNKAVRYQFDISNTARECQPQGSQFALKIGVSGLALVGPAGAPGAYSADLKVLVSNASDHKPVYQKSYKVSVDTKGASQGEFQLVADPIMLPLTRTDLDNIYDVTIGLGDTVKEGAPQAEHKRRPHPPKTPTASNAG
jgi:hypothetical protein